MKNDAENMAKRGSASAAAYIRQTEQAMNALRRGQSVSLQSEGETLCFAAAEIKLSTASAQQGQDQDTCFIASHDAPLALLGSSIKAVPPSTLLHQKALELLRKAQLLPIAMEQPQQSEPLVLSAHAIEHYELAIAESLQQVAQAHLPLSHAENAKIHVFRSPLGGVEHLAIVVGDVTQAESPLVRVHSSCLTGDLLGSLRCDCGDQLHLALESISAQGAGIVLYLNQEGRGIGIANKIRAYALQEQGQDTLQANESLGFAADERRFEVAAAMLKLLKVDDIKLLTNNPQKMTALESLGIKVTERVSLIAKAGEHNAHYLDTKAKRFGHLL